MARIAAVVNNADLVQRVRSPLGRDRWTRELPRPNGNSCKLMVTLYGRMKEEECRTVEEAVR